MDPWNKAAAVESSNINFSIKYRTRTADWKAENRV